MENFIKIQFIVMYLWYFVTLVQNICAHDAAGTQPASPGYMRGNANIASQQLGHGPYTLSSSTGYFAESIPENLPSYSSMREKYAQYLRDHDKLPQRVNEIVRLQQFHHTLSLIESHNRQVRSKELVSGVSMRENASDSGDVGRDSSDSSVDQLQTGTTTSNATSGTAQNDKPATDNTKQDGMDVVRSEIWGFTLGANWIADLLPEEIDEMFGTTVKIFNKPDPTTPAPALSANPQSKTQSLQPLTPEQGQTSQDLLGVSPEQVLPSLRKDDYRKSRRYLNWASFDNPIGLPVSPIVRNQGGCGACWAFTAAGATEMMLRIVLTPSQQADGNNREDPNESIAKRDMKVEIQGEEDAQQATAQNREGDLSASKVVEKESPSQKKSVAHIPALSMQQLIDCDHSFNRGCSGGNPFYAFRYIKINGLVPYKEYPFEEKVSACHVGGSQSYAPEEHTGSGPTATSVDTIATSSSYATKADRYYISDYRGIPPLKQDEILSALQNGPVAVGICGTDFTFLFYARGIYDAVHCCTEQNHAMLIVGYGIDEETDKEYWIAQNSWGDRWGEKGFMRILRTTVEREGQAVGLAGICGMSQNPTVALGGYIVGADGEYVDPAHDTYNPFMAIFVKLGAWLQENWQSVMMTFSGALMLSAFALFLYGWYLDRVLYLRAQLRASAQGYHSI